MSYKNLTDLKLSTLIERRKKMQEEFKKYLTDQLGFDSDGGKYAFIRYFNLRYLVL